MPCQVRHTSVRNTLDNFSITCNKRIIMEDRIAKLEMVAAEQERAMEEMSTVIARQWREIEALQVKLEQLTRRFAALEEQTAPDVPVTKPPHY